MEQEIAPKKSFLASGVVSIVLAALLVIAIGAGVYFYQKAAADPQKEAAKELQNTIAAVGKLIVLPEGETPTMATVNDPEKLKSQPFFTNAQTGDKVLIYPTSRKAILYRPSSNKIVEVAPVNTGTAGVSGNASF